LRPTQNGSFVYVNYPLPEDDAIAEAAAARGDGGMVIREEAAAKPTGPVRMGGSLKSMREDAERRKVVVLTMESGAVGAQRRETVELPETATVGELRARAAEQLGIPVGSVGLARGRAEAGSVTAQRQFGTDDARLTSDPNGPRLEGGDRISAVIFAHEADGAAAPDGPAAAGPAGLGAAAAAAASSSSSSAASVAGTEDGSIDLSSLPADLRPPEGAARDPAALRRFLKQNAEFITFQGTATHRQIRINMNPFLNQHLQTRRVAWLFGTVTDAEASSYAAQGAGKVVSVEAIYEPPQLGFKHRVALAPDPDAPFVELLAASLRLVPVGWLFTAPFRGEVENVMTSSELLTAARMQSKHPHFMTVAFTFEQQQDAALGRARIFRSSTAWQLSEQAVRLYKAGQLHRDAGDDPFHVRTRRSVMASDPDDPMRQVRAVKRFHTSYLVSPAGIQSLSEADTLLSARFPVMNRRTPSGDVIEVTPEEARKAVFGLRAARGEGGAVTGSSIRETMLARVADFSFLLWLCKHGTALPYPVSGAEVVELCEYVATHDGAGAASFRFKLMAALGAGWLCPLTERTRGYDDVRESPEDLRDHIARTFGDDETPVVNPLDSVRSSTRSERERLAPNLLTRLRAELGRGAADEDAAAALGGMGHRFGGGRMRALGGIGSDAFRVM